MIRVVGEAIFLLCLAFALAMLAFCAFEPFIGHRRKDGKGGKNGIWR